MISPRVNLCIFRSSSSAISGESSILGTMIFSLARKASGRPFNAAKGINCLALSDTGILFSGLFATAMSSDLCVPFPGGSMFFKIHTF